MPKQLGNRGDRRRKIAWQLAHPSTIGSFRVLADTKIALFEHGLKICHRACEKGGVCALDDWITYSRDLVDIENLEEQRKRELLAGEYPNGCFAGAGAKECNAAIIIRGTGIGACDGAPVDGLPIRFVLYELELLDIRCEEAKTPQK